MLDGNEVPAGGEARVAVNIRTGARKRRIRQVIQVQTNDSEQESFSLTVQASVLVDVDVLPNSVLRFSGEQARSASLTLKNYSKKPVQLSGIDSSVPHVNISLSSMTIPPEGEVQLHAELLPDTPKGVLSGWLKIKTGLKSLPLLQIRIWGMSNRKEFFACVDVSVSMLLSGLGTGTVPAL